MSDGATHRSGVSAAFGVLSRLRQQSDPAPGRRCEFCAAEIAGEGSHSHVVNVEHRNLLCSCRGCALLFTEAGAAQGRYRSVPDRYLRLPSTLLTRPQWEEMQIPVGMAFFFHNSHLDRTVAFYPSPAGATESELPLEEWQRLVGSHSSLGEMASDVEALLVRDLGGELACYIVPIDRCYELVGYLRLHWRGFDGGTEARHAIASFFDDVHRRSRPAAGASQEAGP